MPRGGGNSASIPRAVKDRLAQRLKQEEEDKQRKAEEARAEEEKRKADEEARRARARADEEARRARARADQEARRARARAEEEARIPPAERERRDAEALLLANGITGTESERKAAWKAFNLANHPDKGGNTQLTQQVNGAYNLYLQRIGRKGGRHTRKRRHRKRKTHRRRS
jgi:membrane protein involved in colicin uptake